ncbi:ATP-dependent nuclease [Blastococcus sp. SYSU DS0510]
MIERLRLHRYKGFHAFTLHLSKTTIIVGPNNAGKSTLAQCVRLASGLLRHARKRSPSATFTDSVFESTPRQVLGYALNTVANRELAWFNGENVHHEFREEGAGFELTFKSGSRLRVVWPQDEDDLAFFYIDRAPGLLARMAKQVREGTPVIGVIPTLSGVEHREEVLTKTHVDIHMGTRLTSRHFRNLLHYALAEAEEDEEDEAGELLDFLYAGTPEITDIEVEKTYAPGQAVLDVYVTEAISAGKRELYWMGDGLQVWLQLLFHLWRHRQDDVLVLDEPDVFLHPDLQRRLVTLLEERSCQVVLATHAPEILAEASRNAVTWIDRSRRSSKKVRETADFAQLNSSLGSSFNLALARALRSKVALFVEGEDMKLIRGVAQRLGLARIASEVGLAVIPLGGYQNWHQVEPFAWLTKDLLGDAVKPMVLLDRDHRSAIVVKELVDGLANQGISAHVWQRKELESYFLNVALIGRAAHLDLDVAKGLLDGAIEDQRTAAQAAYVWRRQQEARRDIDPKTVMLQALPEFDAIWADPERRFEVVPPKDVIAQVSRESQALGGKSFSVRTLINRMYASEVPVEMANYLRDVEIALSGA